ncbi:hypothetical protein glysoja_028316 [Glycine soja]|uniref:Uncharacterized protein n=1 Tax=Glycine soja TaxID=3848 RepID=A0A0B2P375_GLYSO|nr:hypothetical protein glysoja_028316 [Glycine soja]
MSDKDFFMRAPFALPEASKRLILFNSLFPRWEDYPPQSKSLTNAIDKMIVTPLTFMSPTTIVVIATLAMTHMTATRSVTIAFQNCLSTKTLGIPTELTTKMLYQRNSVTETPRI